MNPISVIFVLVIFSGLQDYTAAAAVKGKYDATTAAKIINCANAAYNQFNESYNGNHFPGVEGPIGRETLNSKIRSLLVTDEMANKFHELMNTYVPQVQPSEILSFY